MDIFKIEKKGLKQVFDKLSKKYSVYAPVESDGITSFREIANEIPKQVRNDNLELDFYNTDKSPKEVFFPQAETMISYDCREQACLFPTYEGKPIALFGVRPCDAKSFSLLNKVFDPENAGKTPNTQPLTSKTSYVDTYWKERYKDALVFALACNEPLSTCFCNCVDGGPFNKDGADVFLVDIGDSFLIESCSDKGVGTIHELPLQRATKEDLKKMEKIKDETESMLSKPINLAVLKEKLSLLWDNPIWEELAYKCIGCAVCTYLCPTCHCFDIQDEGKGSKVSRIRIWDSCAFKLFTQEAAGTNPRPTTKERLRQRMMHKFNYFVENLGEFGCVGCGRCVRECPVNLDVREVIKSLVAG